MKKQRSGSIINITSINATEEGAIKLFTKQKNCDAYIVNQGEKGFAELMKKFIEVDKDMFIGIELGLAHPI